MLRLPVQDHDSPFTSAWRAKFNISNGNEEGHFDISTDPETNEGILHVIKVKQHRAHTGRWPSMLRQEPVSGPRSVWSTRGPSEGPGWPRTSEVGPWPFAFLAPPTKLISISKITVIFYKTLSTLTFNIFKQNLIDLHRP